MTELLVGRCRNCGDALSYFALACPYCGESNLPNPVATIAALSAVVLAGGVIAFGVYAFRGKAAEPSAPQAEGAPPATDTETVGDYGWIVKAMAECEEEAKQKQGTMHFLIVPVTATGVTVPGFSASPISSVGNAAVLLSSTDTLIGLRNRVLALYQKPVTFAVTDPATKTVYKWKSAVGVTSLKSRETGSASLTLGFEIPDVAKEIEWGPTINLNKGTCYWINPLVRGSARSG
jgi:hypothetical protein